MGERITDEDRLRPFDVLLEHMASDWPGQGPVTAQSPPQLGLGTLMGNVDITLGVGVGVAGGVGVASTTGFLTGPRRPDPQTASSPAPPPHNYNLFQQQQVCAIIQQHMHPTTQQLQQLHHLQQQQQLHLQLQIHQQHLQQQQHHHQLQQLHQQQQIHQQQLHLQQQRLQHPPQPIPQMTNAYPPQQLQQQFQQHLQQQLHQQQQQLQHEQQQLQHEQQQLQHEQQQLQQEQQQLKREQQPQNQHQLQQTQQQPASQLNLQQNEHQTPLFTPNQDQLIQNLVGNWTVPNLTGTYNPFGLRQMQTTDVIQEPTQPEKTPIIINTKRTRVVAEVRPMRPSYSAVLTTPFPSPSPQKPNSPAITISFNNVDNLNSLKAETGWTKGGTNNNTSNSNSKPKKNGTNGGASGKLRRQHSSGSDEQSSSSSSSTSTSTPKSTQTNSSQGSRTNRKSTGEGSNNALVVRSKCNKLGSTLSRRWVSLDDLDNNGNNDSDVFQHFDTNKQSVTKKAETSPNASRKKSKGHPRNSNQDESSLNNQKASSSGGSAKSLGGMGPGSTKRPIHINNLGTPHWSTTKDMGREAPREISKTSKNGRGSVEEKRGSCSSYKSESKPNTSGCSFNSNPPPTMLVHISSNNANRSSSRGSADKNSGSQRSRNQRGSRRKDRVAAFVALLRGYAKLALVVVYWFLHLLSDVLEMSLRLTLHMFAFVWESWILCAAHWLKELVESGVQRLRGTKSNSNSSRSGSMNPEGRESVIPGGLTSNISMPSTGDEAMKRLLACKGKDPYSILGVTPTCTDDDVKRYYKRQAFLVHPDKNNQPGAEEAFKILVHAFELIGEPEKRTDYDRCVAETQQVEQAWSELGELLSQLHQKMEYAANTIKCTNCGKRHKRITVLRKPFAARFCAQCKIKHSAKEGDMWAETTFWGILWRYYACMDGAVHDITEWAACQGDNLRHLKPNSHSVQYRIVLGTQQRQHQHGRGPSESDLEHFLSSLYNQSGGVGTKSSGTSEADDAGGAAGCAPSGAPAGGGANGAETAGTSQGGRKRRKGKRNKF